VSPSGFVYLNLVSDISYLAACARETCVEDEALAKQVADCIARFGPKVHYSSLTVAGNASAFLYYLAQQQASKLSPKEYLECGFSGVEPNTKEVVNRAQRAIVKERISRGWHDFDERFAVGMEYSGTVDGIHDYGVFVKLDGGPTVLLYYRNLPSDRPVSSFVLAARIVIEILDIQIESQEVSLGFVADEGTST